MDSDDDGSDVVPGPWASGPMSGSSACILSVMRIQWVSPEDFGGQSLSPLYVDRDAKSLVKHPLTAGLSMRCGSLKDGVNDGFFAWSATHLSGSNGSDIERIRKLAQWFSDL